MRRAGRMLPLVLMVAAAMAGCGDKKEKKPGQTLASVNGEEITVSQLNEELQRANVSSAQQEQASRQLLVSLVDRQLLLAEAGKDKLDRDPKVVQAIERAKAQILAQAYLQKRIGQPARPSKEEVSQYFNQHPELFSQRKVFQMRQLVLSTDDVTTEVKGVIDAAKSLDEVATWLSAHKVKFAAAPLTRASTDLPPELSKRLLAMPQGQLFLIKEGARSVLATVVDIKDAPLALDAVAPQIEQLLVSQRNKEAAEAELTRLRSAAKIVYFNRTTGAEEAAPPAPMAPTAPTAAKPAGAEADKPAAPDAAAANERGVAGLK
jgi:EpsD family peptidyl-prolyl cis-trans isomerase